MCYIGSRRSTAHTLDSFLMARHVQWKELLELPAMKPYPELHGAGVPCQATPGGRRIFVRRASSTNGFSCVCRASAAMSTLITFDVDGTLIESVGDMSNALHKEAFVAAFKDVYGVDTHIDVVQVRMTKADTRSGKMQPRATCSCPADSDRMCSIMEPRIPLS